MRFPKTTPRSAGLLVATVVFLFFSIAINIQAHGWVSWYRLAVHGQEVQGAITGRRPEIHRKCYFEYTVKSHRYQGADEGCHSEVGQLVTIRYLPAEPSFATTSSPTEQLAFLLLAPLALSVFAGAMTAWRVLRRGFRGRTVPH